MPERRFISVCHAAPESLGAPDWSTAPGYLRRRLAAERLRPVVDEDRWSVEGSRPPEFGPAGVAPTEPDRRSQTGRALPLLGAIPAPLELVMPVQSFALAGTAMSLPGDRRRPAHRGHRDTAVAKSVPAGRSVPVNLRQVHPADPVRLPAGRGHRAGPG